MSKNLAEYLKKVTEAVQADEYTLPPELRPATGGVNIGEELNLVEQLKIEARASERNARMCARKPSEALGVKAWSDHAKDARIAAKVAKIVLTETTK